MGDQGQGTRGIARPTSEEEPPCHQHGAQQAAHRDVACAGNGVDRISDGAVALLHAADMDDVGVEIDVLPWLAHLSRRWLLHLISACRRRSLERGTDAGRLNSPIHFRELPAQHTTRAASRQTRAAFSCRPITPRPLSMPKRRSLSRRDVTQSAVDCRQRVPMTDAIEANLGRPMLATARRRISQRWDLVTLPHLNSIVRYLKILKNPTCKARLRLLAKPATVPRTAPHPHADGRSGILAVGGHLPFQVPKKTSLAG